MAKTKVLVKRFIESDDKETTFVEIIKEMGNELETIQKSRNIKTDRGLIPIFRDMDKKYQSFVGKVNAHYGKKVLKYTMFRIWLEQFYPIAYIYYTSTNP